MKSNLEFNCFLACVEMCIDFMFTLFLFDLFLRLIKCCLKAKNILLIAGGGEDYSHLSQGYYAYVYVANERGIRTRIFYFSFRAIIH